MSVTTDSLLESRHKKPSTWERLSTKQKLLSLVLTIGIPAGMMVGLAQTYGSFHEGISTAGGKAVPAGEHIEHIFGSASVGAPQEKVAITVELQRERAEAIRARQLANSAWFVYPEVDVLSDGEVLLPIDELQEMTVEQKRYEEIVALRKLNVSWDTIETLVNHTRIARIDKATVTEGKKSVKKYLSFALRGKASIAEISVADFGFMTLPHEDAHTLFWTGIRSIDEAAATWFQYYVNGGTPPKPPKFTGCGLAPGEFDYASAYYDFDQLSIWFGSRTGANLFATMVEIYSQWAGHPLEREEQPMPIEHLYKQIEAKYKIPKAEIKARFQAPESFQCR